MVVRIELGDLLSNSPLGEILLPVLVLFLILNQIGLLLRRDLWIKTVLEKVSIYVFRGFVESVRLVAVLSLAFTMSLVVLLQYLEFYSRRGDEEQT